jgi:acetyltransferase-like isoleucine patch superfamily enzyme
MRKFFVEIKRLVAVLAMLPFWILTFFTKYVYVGQAISMIPFHFGEIVRYEFYRWTLAACGEDVTIGFGSYVSYPDVTIGNHVWMDAFCNVGHADIGDYVIVARNCHFVSGDHPFARIDIPIWKQHGVPGRIKIGSDVWFGSGVIVMDDVNSGCVVGAGSVVTQSLPPFTVAVGSPARVIRTRTEHNSRLNANEE